MINNCPLNLTGTLPATETCRQNRKLNRLSYGMSFGECARCGRDLGAKTNTGKDGRDTVNPLGGRAEGAGRRLKATEHGNSPRESTPPSKPTSMSAGVTTPDSQGRATGKDAPRPHSNRFMSFAGGPTVKKSLTVEIAPRNAAPPPKAVAHRPKAEKRQEGGKAQEKPPQAHRGPEKFSGVLVPTCGRGGIVMKLKTRPGFVQTWEREKRNRGGWPKGVSRKRWTEAVVGAAG
ncbi:MAG: hypothetical protein ACYDG4_13450 [Desulfuromonadaceae bacterium]